MLRTITCLVFACGFGAWLHAVDPLVSNVLAQQRDGTELVDITYTLADADSATVAVTIAISSDGGATWTVPCTHATGAVGAGVAPGADKAIVWDAGADWTGLWSEHMRVKVTADDPSEPPPDDEFALILAGTNSGSYLDIGDYSLTVNAFYMGRYEVTKAKWDVVRTWAASNGYTDLPTGDGKGPTHPVYNVNWFDVVKWCNARSEMEGRSPAYYTTSAKTTVYRMEDIELDDDCVNWAGGYRLPTLNEWEYAARGGLSSKRFPWGDTIDHTQANYYGNPHQYDYDLGYERYDTSYQVGEIPFTSPVGSFPANGYGLYDMTGNLWEWNWFPGFNRTPRPLRGSSWNDSSYCGRVAYVFRNVPGWRSYIQGFRLCTAGPG
jgi:hypothetical protein